MKLYDKIKMMLTTYPAFRNSDKLLIWYIISDGKESITQQDFMKSAPFESITRARRAVQEHHPELQASKEVQEARKKKASDPNGWLF